MDTMLRVVSSLLFVLLWSSPLQIQRTSATYFNGNGADNDNFRSMGAPAMAGQRRPPPPQISPQQPPSYSSGYEAEVRNGETVGICLDRFQLNADTIIRTQDSRVLGARYLNETELPSKEACFYWCCQISGCNVAVFEEKDRGSCYLFDCGPPTDFKCKFTSHHRYTSAILDTSSSDSDKQQQLPVQSNSGGRAGAPSYPATTSADEHISALKNLHNVPVAVPNGALPPLTTAPPVGEVVHHPAEVNINMVSTPPTTSSPLPTLDSSKMVALPAAVTGTPGARTPVCSHFQFQCRTSGECIAVYNACDGIPQCLDHSDEAEDLGCPNAEGRRPTGSSSTTTPFTSKVATVDKQEIPPETSADKYEDGGKLDQQQQQTSEDGAPVASNIQPQTGVASSRAGAITRQQQQSLLHHFNPRPHEENHHEQKLKELSQSIKNAASSGPQSPSGTVLAKIEEYDAHIDRRPLPPEDARRPETAGGASAGNGYDVATPNEYEPETPQRVDSASSNGNGPYEAIGNEGHFMQHSGLGYNNAAPVNLDRGSKVQQGYSRTYSNDNRQSFKADPSIVIPGAQTFPRKNHLSGQDNGKNVGPVNVVEVQKVHQAGDNTGRRFGDSYDQSQQNFDSGHPDKIIPSSVDNHFGAGTRNFAREHNYEGGYQSSAETEYVPQPNSYPQEARDPSQSHHVLNGQTGVINNWAPNSYSSDESFPRNGQYSETNMGSAQQSSFAEAQRHSNVPLTDDQQQSPQHQTKYDKGASGQLSYDQEDANKYWTPQSTGHQVGEGRKSPPVQNSNQPDYRVPNLEVNHVVINKGSELHRQPSPNSQHSTHQPPHQPPPPKSQPHQTPSPKGGATGAAGSGSLLRNGNNGGAVVVKPQSRVDRVEVSLAEVEVNRAERSSESNGAVFALTLGLSITGLLLVLVGCRLRMVRRRLRRGRSPYAHDADYLVNGMYL